MKKIISLVIPAYNEEDRIKPMLAAYHDYFRKNFSDFEFLVIVEGRDNTKSIVDSFSKKDRRIKCFYSETPLGKGGAVIKGFKMAAGDYIGFVDADGSTKPEVFADLIKNLADYDGVIASRKVFGAKLIKKEPLLQRIGSRGFNAIVRVLFFMPFKDTQCGAKIFKKDAIIAALKQMTLANWAFDIDLLYILYKSGFRILELPTIWEYKVGAQFDFNKWFRKLVPMMFLSLMRLRFVHSRYKSLTKLANKIYRSFFEK